MGYDPSNLLPVKEMIAKDVQDIINYDPRIQVNAVGVDSTEQGIRIEAPCNVYSVQC